MPTNRRILGAQNVQRLRSSLRIAVLTAACSRCDRAGRYGLDTLIARHGPGFGVPDCCDCCRPIARSGSHSVPTICAASTARTFRCGAPLTDRPQRILPDPRPGGASRAPTDSLRRGRNNPPPAAVTAAGAPGSPQSDLPVRAALIGVSARRWLSKPEQRREVAPAGLSSRRSRIAPPSCPAGAGSNVRCPGWCQW
jgi:hypothetical protein